ncbi:MAG: response regulator [Candidatus Nealsonbacteria bacterium]
MKNKILLIEDDLAIVDVYTISLTRAGFEIQSVGLGKEALKILKNEKNPDLILLDLILPDMNGIKILEEIRKNEKTKDLPVFVLTNYADRELEKMGHNLKTEKYLLKASLTPSELVKIVNKKLG